MTQYSRVVAATVPSEQFNNALELLHASARMYDDLAELQSAYHLADRASSKLMYFGLYATKDDLDATSKGAHEQMDAFCAVTGSTVDLWEEYEVMDENH